jgi:hypothetical protein
MRAVPCLFIKLCPGIRLTTEENHGKTSVGVAEKCLTEDCQSQHYHYYLDVNSHFKLSV